MHSTRLFNESLKEDCAIIKIDMRNAFNSVRRDLFLRQVREHAPTMYHLLWQAYRESTPLFYGTVIITSATGLQQGDPCGPAVFSLAIDEVVKAVKAPFNCWYLDDGTMAGSVSAICSDLNELIPAMGNAGLTISSSKCEIILPVDITDEQRKVSVASLRQLIPGAAVTDEPGRTILGAPISEAATEAIMREKQGELSHMIERLRHLDAHTSIFLLRNCLWLPKLQNLLRAAPLYRQASLLEKLDAVLQSALISISNVRLTETIWQQAVHPTRYGGLRLRRLVDVALPSYVASLHLCLQVISSCLPSAMTSSATAEREKAVAGWEDAAGGDCASEGDEAQKQKTWDAVLAKKQQELLLSQSNQFDRARLLSASTPESGAWLHAVPAATIGTLLDPETLRVAIALRLGAEVCRPHRCRCGSVTDSNGYHALTYKFSAGRHPRHTALNDIIAMFKDAV